MTGEAGSVTIRVSVLSPVFFDLVSCPRFTVLPFGAPWLALGVSWSLVGLLRSTLVAQGYPRHTRGVIVACCRVSVGSEWQPMSTPSPEALFALSAVRSQAIRLTLWCLWWTVADLGLSWLFWWGEVSGWWLFLGLLEPARRDLWKAWVAWGTLRRLKRTL
jgi:hypothetical protein